MLELNPTAVAAVLQAIARNELFDEEDIHEQVELGGYGLIAGRIAWDFVEAGGSSHHLAKLFMDMAEILGSRDYEDTSPGQCLARAKVRGLVCSLLDGRGDLRDDDLRTALIHEAQQISEGNADDAETEILGAIAEGLAFSQQAHLFREIEDEKSFPGYDFMPALLCSVETMARAYLDAVVRIGRRTGDARLADRELARLHEFARQQKRGDASA